MFTDWKRHNQDTSHKNYKQFNCIRNISQRMEISNCGTSSKKGDLTYKKNYSPISCLVTALKVMEKVVCASETDIL